MKKERNFLVATNTETMRNKTRTNRAINAKKKSNHGNETRILFLYLEVFVYSFVFVLVGWVNGRGWWKHVSLEKRRALVAKIVGNWWKNKWQTKKRWPKKVVGQEKGEANWYPILIIFYYYLLFIFTFIETRLFKCFRYIYISICTPFHTIQSSNKQHYVLLDVRTETYEFESKICYPILCARIPVKV